MLNCLPSFAVGNGLAFQLNLANNPNGGRHEQGGRIDQSESIFDEIRSPGCRGDSFPPNMQLFLTGGL